MQMRWSAALRSLVWTVAVLAGSHAATADAFACNPCAGIHAADPRGIIEAFNAEPQLDEETPFVVAWSTPLDEHASVTELAAVREAGARPWLRAIFRSPAPLADHLERLEEELRQLVRLTDELGEGATVQAVWEPASGSRTASDHAFLLKRAAVAVTGAVAEANFAAGPFAADPAALEALYGEELAAYLDVVVLAPTPSGLETAVLSLAALDPGKPVVLDAVPFPETPSQSLATAAASAAAGVRLTLFDVQSGTAPDLTPLKLLAREFAGDVSYAGQPGGSGNSWSFVRGEDLGLRVIAEAPTGGGVLDLQFDDSALRGPTRVDLTTGAEELLFNARRRDDGFTVTLEEPEAVSLVRLGRLTAAELEGLEGLDERIDVADDRQMTVEEILRRLQAFEDDQARRLDHYEGRNTLHLRFLGGGGSVEASYVGDFFFQRDGSFDWVWEEFLVDGVKWRSKRIPELPLIQPEKAASLPVEILLTRDYNYRLRGTETIDGRDCWVIDFRPSTDPEGRSLYRGTVWVDREIYARIRTRAIQLGLEGDVLSNEETVSFTPLDEAGNETAWGQQRYVLPTQVVGQQTVSVLNATVPIERETVLTDIRINGQGFDSNREAALASDLVMVRDTDAGIRYLKKNEDGEREVELEPDTNRLFLVGGIFWDESVDFPIPLAGLNYLDFDFRDSGNQLNIFFAGPLVTINVAEPRLFDSRWDAGINANGFFLDGGDEIFRDGVEVAAEEIERRDSSVSMFLGRPLGTFFKLDLTYRVDITSFGRADVTAEEFVLPQDHLTHAGQLDLSYNRAGYRLNLIGSFNSRSDWEFWGLPDNTEFNQDQEEYVRWQGRLTKNWWFSKFRKLTVSVEHLGGDNLDRFSTYDFGIFGDSTVAGYQSGLVTGNEANGVHVEYGINAGGAFRLELEGDAVWATNELTGLDNELLAGIGIGGTVTLPWSIIADFEIGTALEGPGEGDIAARIFFLKLFRGKMKR